MILGGSIYRVAGFYAGIGGLVEVSNVYACNFASVIPRSLKIGEASEAVFVVGLVDVCAVEE